MRPLLNALCAWRRTVTGLEAVTFFHVLERRPRATPPAMPYSQLSIKLAASDQNVGVPFTLTERILVPSLTDVDALTIDATVAILRAALSRRSSYAHGARILTHVLQPEETAVDSSGKGMALLTWTGRASWDKPAPSANFSYDAGQFTDTSDGTPTSWLWDFGDSTTSTAQSPAHTYAATGDYDVVLTAYNRHGWTTLRKTVSAV